MKLNQPNSSMVRVGVAGSNAYKEVMHQAIDEAAKWLEENDLYKGAKPDDLRNLYRHLEVMPERGLGVDRVIKDASNFILKNSLQVHHPSCVAHLHCPTTLAVQAAEVLLNISNQSMDSWDQSPSGTLLEQRMIVWLRNKVGFQEGDAGVFTSGGTLSNLMGILLARDYAIKKHWGVSTQMFGIPPEASKLVILCSEKAHFSVKKSAHLLGLGEHSVIALITDESDRINVPIAKLKIEELKQSGKIPFCIVATAGTTDAGAFDPITEIAMISEEHDIWLHVDAAWGGSLLLSHKYKQLLGSIEKAHSITLDFHKHFFQTISSSAFLLKDPNHYQLIHSHADYLNPAEDVAEGTPNLVEKSLQTTRRFDALKLWMTLRSIGGVEFGKLIDKTVELAKEVALLVKKYSELKLIQEPQLSSVLFRIELKNHSESELNKLNRDIANHLLTSGIANLGITKRDGNTILKFTFLNPHTELKDVKQILDQIIFASKKQSDSTAKVLDVAF